MRKVLLLGGYGTFGGRIAQRLAEAGFEVLVAGRSAARAESFCAGRPGLVPLALDRDRGLADALARHRPFALIDAAGPFQGADYKVPRAAIAAGCHYLDIADARDFVCGIGALDAEAKAAGVAAIAGASSLPALSGAAARRLAEGMEVRAVEVALSATSLGTAGRSVIGATLSYLGRPVRLRRGGRWETAFGWQEIERRDFAVDGAPPLKGRLLAIADVPDLELLPERLPGRPAVIFRAGTDRFLHNLGLWLLSWPLRRRWLRRIAPLAGSISRLQRWTSFGGSRRSALAVRMFGIAGGRRLERSWSLIAGDDHGPHIPALTVPILLARAVAGGLAPGARDAGELLQLEDYAESLNGLSTVQQIVETELPPPLYERVMGSAFAALPPSVREMHDLLADGGASGKATVTRGRNPIARAIAWLAGFPAEGEHDLHVAFAERDGRERWTRDFSGRRFSSRLYERGGLLVERFGPSSFGFELSSDGNGLDMVLRRWWLGPLPMPMALAPRTPAREWEEEGRFHFDVRVALPLIGPVVHYRGWLEKGSAE